MSSRSRVFVDSSVIIAASISSGGYARDLINAGLQHEVVLIWSDLVMEETERNLRAKAPAAVPIFQAFRQTAQIEVASADRQTTQRAEETVDPKDAPIVAAAVAGGASWIASYDRRHLLAYRDEIQSEFGVIVATPDEIFRQLRQ
ncbi:MAG: PIN domain-containing protein [Thermomicrobiales bacterium]